MKRRITFEDTPEARERFGLLYLGMLQAKVAERSMETLRKEARIMTALEAVSVPSQNGGPPRTLSAPVSVELEQPDFELLVSYLERVSWFPGAARQVVALADQLAVAEKVEG